MKTALIFQPQDSAKFWNIEVQGNQHIITFGNVNSNGVAKTTSFDSNEEAVKDAEKLIRLKKKMGYEELVDSSSNAWFEDLEEKVFEIYKNEVLRYKPDQYKSFRLTNRGDSDRYAMGLEKEEKGDYWEGINAAYDYEFEDFWNVCDDAFGEEGIKNRWPIADDDSYSLNGFLTCVILGKVCLRLRNDDDLKKHLCALTTVSIDFDDSLKIPYHDCFPDYETREIFVNALAGVESNRKLILDLWADSLNDVGCDFLKSLGKPIPQKLDSDIVIYKSVFQKATDLWNEDETEEAVELLEPALNDLIDLIPENQNELIEQGFSRLASFHKELENTEAALKAYHSGMEYLPNGYGVLNLLALYKSSGYDNEKMFDVANELVTFGRFSNDEYEYYALSYLGFANLRTDRSIEALEVYKRLKNKMSLIKDPSKTVEIIEDLKELIKDGKNEKINEILKLFV